MAKREKITDAAISSIIKAEIANADGNSGSQLMQERSENLDAYFGRPYGNEQEGRSSVVIPIVRNAIEWMMPTLIRIFLSGENVVEFQPQGPEDVNSATQATEYVNYVWTRDNPGFLTMYSWFKDALLSKNGFIKIWWDDTPRKKRERYAGLDDSAFATLVNDDSVEVAEHTERQEQIEQPPQQDPQTGQLTPQKPLQVTVHDVVITRTLPGGRVCVDTIPPEEFGISREGRDMEGARVVYHRRRRPLSDLVEEGFDKDLVESLVGDEANVQTNIEEISRNTIEQNPQWAHTTSFNTSMREVWVTEAYIRLDVDGDGVAEMRQVTVAGSAYTVLKNEPWDMERPFVSLTPMIMPHRFYGQAVADVIKIYQLMSSTVARQYFDNLYLSNNQREQVIESQIIDPTEALSHKPGQKIRVKSAEAIFPIVTPNIGPMALEGLQYIDKLVEEVTGVSERTQGIGQDSLDNTATQARMMMSAAQGRIELIARVFAETGVSQAFRKILKLIVEYQDKPRQIRLKNNWTEMDPRSWNADMDLTVSVGMGTGDKDQQMQHAMLLGQAQAALLPQGMVTPENMMNTAELLVNSMGQKGVERFFSMPQQGSGPPQPPPNPAHVAQAQRIQQATQLDAQKHQASMGQMQAKTQTDAQKVQSGMQNQAMQIQGQAQLEQQKAAQQATLAMQELYLKKYQLDNEIALKQEQMQAEIAIKQQVADNVRLGGKDV